MRSLSDTVARLAALRKRDSTPFNAAGLDRLSDMATFGSNPGQLRGRIYLPKGLGPNSPLVVVLHGCTQTAAAYDYGSGWSTLADREGFALLFPEQQRSNNANLCFNWFVREDICRGSGEVLSIHQMIEAMIVAHRVDRRRVFVTGLSAGGAMASAMLASYPDVFAGGAIIAGLAYGTAFSIPEAFDRMRGHGGPTSRELQQKIVGASDHNGPWPRISVWQGDADLTVNSSNADRIVSQWQAVHGVSESAPRETTVDGCRQLVWHDQMKREVIASYRIAGMAHGTPLDADDGLGNAGPFMLDVGISSTKQIAEFWGISALDTEKAESSQTGTEAAAISRPPRRLQWDKSIRTPSPPGITGTGVSKIIEDALRKAGVLK